MADVTIYVNTDTVDSPIGTSGVSWTEVDTSNDYFVFSAGSSAVADGEVIPSAGSLTSAGVRITTVDVPVAHYFLADISAGILKEIHLAGNQNKRYVFGFSFDGATASEPILEVWDNASMNTAYNYSLGGDPVGLTESPTTSWIRGITTTDGLPGADWVGSRLGGSSAGHFLYLNNENGALSGADILYCNLKIIVPASFSHSRTENNVFVCKWTTN